MEIHLFICFKFQLFIFSLTVLYILSRNHLNTMDALHCTVCFFFVISFKVVKMFKEWYCNATVHQSAYVWPQCINQPMCGHYLLLVVGVTLHYDDAFSATLDCIHGTLNIQMTKLAHGWSML